MESDDLAKLFGRPMTARVFKALASSAEPLTQRQLSHDANIAINILGRRQGPLRELLTGGYAAQTKLTTKRGMSVNGYLLTPEGINLARNNGAHKKLDSILL